MADESFQDFVLESDSEAVRFWQSWLAQHPAHEAAFREAEAALQLLRTAQHPPVPAALKQAEEAKLWQSMREPAAPAARPRLRSQQLTRRWPVALAAVVAVGLLLLGLGWWRQPAAPAYAHYATHAGEQRRLGLPDSSHVVLSANSALTVATWRPGQAREVWLRGSAYFDVQHVAPAGLKAVAQAPAPVKFVVHAGPLDVAVLGTRFTVFSHGSRTKVVLSAGQIQLSRRAGQPAQLLMQPGELVECDAAAPAAPLVKRSVPAKLYSAWTNEQLDFDNTSVADIIGLLQDAYGLQIMVRDPRLLRQKLTGALPTRDLDGLLAAFSKTLDVQVRRQGNRVWLD